MTHDAGVSLNLVRAQNNQGGALCGDTACGCLIVSQSESLSLRGGYSALALGARRARAPQNNIVHATGVILPRETFHTK